MNRNIIYENMTKLGLNTTMEQMQNLPEMIKDRGDPELAEITHKLEVVDYEVKVNNEIVDCYISPAWQKPYNTTYSGRNLKVILRPKFPLFPNLRLAHGDDFIFIDEDMWFNPNYTSINMPLFNPLDARPLLYINLYVQTFVWHLIYPNCKGIMLYDFNKDTYDMVLIKKFVFLPVIFVNGSVGEAILDDRDNATVDYHLEQRYNTSVISYNVVGQLEGKNPDRTVIVDCLYDSWWCQGTADAATGMAMVLALAKYFIEIKTNYNITPKYTLKFIAFGGEEYGFAAGSKYYDAAHHDEDIVYVIDLNQLGFKQDDPKLILNVVCNKLLFLHEIWQIVKRTNYEKRVEYTAGIKPVWMKNGAPSNDRPFARNRNSCKTVSFLKDRAWKLHHRDGLNHTEGDVLNYFYPEDVNVTGEIILNVTKHLVLDPEDQALIP